MARATTIVIEPPKGWRIVNLRELADYRDLFYYLAWRNIKVRYAQSILGIGWAIIQPVFSMMVFTVVFGNLAKVPSDGVPYAIFSFAAVVPWTYFSNSLTASTGSLIQNTALLTKIYCPRLILPLTSVLEQLVDFAIAFLLLLSMMLWFQIYPTMGIVVLPLLILIMMATSAGIGMLLSALSIQYRDIRHATNFMIPLFMYTAPVVYPASLIPDTYRLLYGVNPLVGVIEGFRSALLGTNPMPWDLIITGSVSAVVLLFLGAFYFKKMEAKFADVA